MSTHVYDWRLLGPQLSFSFTCLPVPPPLHRVSLCMLPRLALNSNSSYPSPECWYAPPCCPWGVNHSAPCQSFPLDKTVGNGLLKWLPFWTLQPVLSARSHLSSCAGSPTLLTLYGGGRGAGVDALSAVVLEVMDQQGAGEEGPSSLSESPLLSH